MLRIVGRNFFPMGEFFFRDYMAVKRPVEPKQSPLSSGSSGSWLWLSRICKLLDMAKRLFSISSSFKS